MILSRFWILVLTALSVLSMATALLSANRVNDQWERSAQRDLTRDQVQVEAILRLDARVRIDLLAPIAANGDVRGALRRANGREAGAPVSDEIREPLDAKLTELNGQLVEMRGDILIAIDRSGYIVSAIGAGNIPDHAGLGQFPVARRALEGYVRDDIWVYNGAVYRIAARPVIDGGQYVGALIHGKRFDEEFARRLSSRLAGASVGFYRNDEIFTSHMAEGAPDQGSMAAVLDDARATEGYDAGTPAGPLELPTGGIGLYTQITGSARYAGVGYIVARPVRQLAGPADLITGASPEDWQAVPWLYLGPAGLVLFLLAMLWLWLERDRPLSKMVRATKAVGDAPEDRMTITDFGGRYRKVATNINAALDRATEAAGVGRPKRAAANLDEVLGPTNDDPIAGSGSFFGFADQPSSPLDLPDVPPAGAAAQPPSGSAAQPPTPAPSPPSPGPEPPTPPPPALQPLVPPQSGRQAPAKPPTPAKAPPLRTPPAAPDPARNKALKSTLLGVAPPSFDDDDEDAATMVARVPKELLDQTTAPDEEAHFRDVFEKFVAMKRRCGENTAGLTYEKFVVTLRKNRDQIIKRHGASRVRFTVYEKTGKAALKATPIKG